MASYEYAAQVQGIGDVALPCGAGSAQAIAQARRTLADKPAGTCAEVWRWRTGRGRLPRQGHGVQHRAYVVDADGIVRRTDRARRDVAGCPMAIRCIRGLAPCAACRARTDR